MKISNKEYTKIENKIKEIESGVEIEISVAILDESSDYLESAYLGALFLFFLISVCLFFFKENISLPLVLSSQACALLVGHLLGGFSFFKFFFVSTSRKKEAVYRKAREIYFDHQLASLSKKNGVLILISRFEKSVEIISGELFKQESWEDEIKKITESADEGDIMKGLVNSLNDLKKRLKLKYPASENKKNELSNQIIEN